MHLFSFFFVIVPHLLSLFFPFFWVFFMVGMVFDEHIVYTEIGKRDAYLKVWSCSDQFHCIFILFLYNCLVPLGFLPCRFRLLLSWKTSCDSHATQTSVHAGCFSVSIICQVLTWTTGSLTLVQMHRMGLHLGVYRHRKRVCIES